MADVIQDSGQASYLADFDKPISISVMTQLSQWAFQQQLAYNAQLPYMAADFLGLQDAYDQLNIYSSSNSILQTAWKTIQNTLKLNLNVNKELYVDPSLGQVGILFQSIPSYAKVFTASSDDDLSDIQDDDED